LELLEFRPDDINEHRQRREPAGIRPAPHRVLVRHDVGVQEEQIQVVELQQPQTGLYRLPQDRRDPGAGRISEVALAGDPDTRWQAPAECLAHHALGLAIAIARRHVEQVDPGIDRRPDGGNTLFECSFAPQHAEAAATEGQRGYRRKGAEWMQVHGVLRSIGSKGFLAGPADPAIRDAERDPTAADISGTVM